MKITVEIEIDDEKIKGLLCSAFEGGSNYWYQIRGYKYAPGIKAEDFSEGGKYNPVTDEQPYWHPCQIVPLIEGCAVRIGDATDGAVKVYNLDRKAIERGLKIMQEKYPNDFAAALTDRGDALTGDVFLQCCLFGEAIYG